MIELRITGENPDQFLSQCFSTLGLLAEGVKSQTIASMQAAMSQQQQSSSLGGDGAPAGGPVVGSAPPAGEPEAPQTEPASDPFPASDAVGAETTNTPRAGESDAQTEARVQQGRKNGKPNAAAEKKAAGKKAKPDEIKLEDIQRRVKDIMAGLVAAGKSKDEMNAVLDEVFEPYGVRNASAVPHDLYADFLRTSTAYLPSED